MRILYQMTSKSKRHRGSRTHGGGSHKNRRGAGHRGGRGAAGRSKHEQHNHPPRGKKGFSRPESVQREIQEVNIREIDEDAALYAAEGSAINIDGTYWIDLRSIVEDGWEVDTVKLLGSGRVRQSLHLVADEYSETARKRVEDSGGRVVAVQEGEVQTGVAEEPGTRQETLRVVDQHMSTQWKRVRDGAVLEYSEIEELLDLGERGGLPELPYRIILRGFSNTKEVYPIDVPSLYLLRSYAEKHDLDSETIDSQLESFFEQTEMPEEFKKELHDSLPEEIAPSQLYEVLIDRGERVARAEARTYGIDDKEAITRAVRESQRRYLNLARSRLTVTA